MQDEIFHETSNSFCETQTVLSNIMIYARNDRWKLLNLDKIEQVF